MSQTVGSHIYTGPWINWSHGPIVGSTITLSTRDGSLLTAFLAMFVTATGAAWWRITSYFLHQRNASQERKDGIHHQHQSILRNTSGPGGAAWQFIQTIWYWRKNATRPLLRTMPVLVLAFLNLTLFGLAGIFSSEVTKAAGNETLIRSPNCGYLNISTDDPKQLAFNSVDLNDTLAATSYSRACYGSTQNNLQCNQYVQQSLPWTSNQNATCPFGDDICVYGATAAYEMDTGKLNSHEQLGINARKADRVQFRKVTTCSNLRTRGYFTVVNTTDPMLTAYGDTMQQFAYGEALEGLNYTYQYNTHSPVDSLGYGLQSFLAFAGASTPYMWNPIPALNRTDADVSIFFIAPNSVIYNAPVTDPLFTATTEYNISTGVEGANTTYYQPDRYVYVLSCIDQIQFCNPTSDACTPLFAPSFLEAKMLETSHLGLNAAQLNTAFHIGFAVPQQSTFDNVHPRGANSLRASETVIDNRNVGLPSTHWMTEVSSWFGVSMAKLQQKIVQLATGPDNIPDGATLQLIAQGNKWQKHICNNQKVRSSGDTISFSVLGVAIILIVGTFIILTNLILDILVGFIRSEFGWKDYKRLQWILDEKLQMQRLAYEEAGQGQWSGGADAVPVTSKGDMLGVPVHVDRLHPRLGNRGEVEETGYVGAGGGGMPEAEGLMGAKGGTYTNVQPVLGSP